MRIADQAMGMDVLQTQVLVVGGGTGGTAAAIQAARRGADTILVSDGPWLGGMLTSAGVPAPDGNELWAFQTGLWGQFLRELQRRQPGGLDHAWVSFFTYDPRIGAEIFADWARSLPNLHWIAGKTPRAILKTGDRITGVQFDDVTIHAQIILDGTELGELLALADVPYRWGWDWDAPWQEPSAPGHPNAMTDAYPVQAPTWVVVLQDYGEGAIAPEIPAPPTDNPTLFEGAWESYGAAEFLNYGRLPGNRFMLNWPMQGNDYGHGIQRLIGTAEERSQFWQEAFWHSQSFARFIQSECGRRYGVATPLFPHSQLLVINASRDLLPGFALHPYYRESRRVIGLTTVIEQDILPMPQGQVAALPVNEMGQITAIALGNYANDHHYPGFEFPLKPKSIRWGGRWTGTPFTLPYGCLIPATVDGLLVCEKNISVSHMANGATRLQPTVLATGQAAGMAAALCVECGCQPRDLPVRVVQEALLTDAIAPSAVIPLFNLPPDHPDWLTWQRYYLDHPNAYPGNGYAPVTDVLRETGDAQCFEGVVTQADHQAYQVTLCEPVALREQVAALVTLRCDIDAQLQQCQVGQSVQILGRWNPSGRWILVDCLMA